MTLATIPMVATSEFNFNDQSYKAPSMMGNSVF